MSGGPTGDPRLFVKIPLELPAMPPWHALTKSLQPRPVTVKEWTNFAAEYRPKLDAISNQKLEMLAAALCREYLRWLPGELPRKATETYFGLALRYLEHPLDRLADTADFRPLWVRAMERDPRVRDCPTWHVTTSLVEAVTDFFYDDKRKRDELINAISVQGMRNAGRISRSLGISVIKEQVGSTNSVVFDPSWRTDTVIDLAKHMYVSNDFSAMPILADALQDAGCDSADILNHCRDMNQVHARGCWVVDLVLGKA